MIIAAVSACFSSAAFAQGSVSDVTGMFQDDGITTSGPNAADPVTATTWYTGDISIELLYAAASRVTSAEIAEMNAVAALGLGGEVIGEAYADGFTLVSATTPDGNTAGFLNYTASDGYFSTGPNTIDLLSPVPTGGSGWLAMFATIPAGGGGFFGGFLAWWQSDLGGNLMAPYPGSSAPLTVDPAGQNLVIGVPEPNSVAFAVLGGASLLLLPRRK
jgi:hypothetical protein